MSPIHPPSSLKRLPFFHEMLEYLAILGPDMAHDLSPTFQSAICKATGADAMEVVELIQELWSGYGQIVRIQLDGGSADTVIAKHVRLPDRKNHPRGWNSSLSHERKLKSYQVEPIWYRDWSGRCDEHCRVAKFITEDRHDDDVLVLMEDLDAAGFPARHGGVSDGQLQACLDWLAHFHATFMCAKPDGLWETGTYWHLETRPEELEVLDDLPLKNAAANIDELLSGARYQTLVHGDAKLANFCFSNDGVNVAAVDFQYVGGGCGMKDLAYFLGSCLDEASCEAREGELLDRYFATLSKALAAKQADIDAEEVELEWRTLFPVAWTDFHRFLKGWSPGHWKINSYSDRLAKQVLAAL